MRAQVFNLNLDNISLITQILLLKMHIQELETRRHATKLPKYITHPLFIVIFRKQTQFDSRRRPSKKKWMISLLVTNDCFLLDQPKPVVGSTLGTKRNYTDTFLIFIEKLFNEYGSLQQI